MTALTKLRLMIPPTVRESRGHNVEHVAVWHAEMDVPTTGDHVLAFAREQVGTLPAGAEEVPDPGDPLFFADGKVDANIPGDPAAWATANPGGYFDLTSYALDFEVQPRGSGPVTKWLITVTWRQPIPGQFETPVFQLLYNDPSFSTMPETDPSWKAARDYFVEFNAVAQEESHARLVTDPFGTPAVAGTRTPMLMPNNEPYEPVATSQHENVVVIGHLTRNYGKAIFLNDTYKRTVNSVSFTMDGQAIGAYKARYVSTVISQKLRHRGADYYRLETRLAINKDHHFITRTAIGSYYLSPFTQTATRAFSEEGYPIDRIPIDSAGDWAITPANAATRTYCVYDPVDYTADFSDPVP